MHSDKMFLFGAVSFDTVILKNFMEVSRMKLVLCLIIAVGPDFIKLWFFRKIDHVIMIIIVVFGVPLTFLISSIEYFGHALQ